MGGREAKFEKHDEGSGVALPKHLTRLLLFEKRASARWSSFCANNGPMKNHSHE